MKLKQIIEGLIQEQYTLSQAMRLAKVELFSSPNSKYKKWVDSELDGYNNKTNLPEYRVAQCEIICVVQDYFGSQYEQVLDVTIINNLLSEGNSNLSLNKMYICQGIDSLEEQFLPQDKGNISMEIPIMLQNNLKEMCQTGGDRIIRIYQRTSSVIVGHLLSSVKNKFISDGLEYLSLSMDDTTEQKPIQKFVWEKLTIQEIAEISDDKPIIFFSYSWDSEEHKAWVLQLAQDLQNTGAFHVIIDKMLKKGQYFTHFMEVAVKKATYVLIVGTPNYLQKYLNGSGGVAYEETIITQDLMADIHCGKFIPLLRKGDYSSSFPLILKGINGYNFIDDIKYNDNIDEIVADLG